ncbi:hypothetical protein [Streptomyces sp. AcH 505]|uniref:hypothetical protein n=1 Tax=Streptomyces sp. AcH 505 TaxID=352211 RepID=UPI0006942C95
MTEQETHQGPGVHGGLETHRRARHECPAPDCGPQGVRVVPNHPDDDEGVTIHFPEVDYVDITQVWSVDVGISTEALRELRDAIDKHLDADDSEALRKRIAGLQAERDVLRRSLARLADVVASVAALAFGRDDSRRALLRTKWLTADRVLAYTSGPAVGCDCDRTKLRRNPHFGHFVTCPQHSSHRTRRYGKETNR